MVDFDYLGPVEKGVDYSSVKYDSLTINYRIPYSNTLQQLPLFHTTTRIFQKELNFCSGNGICDSTEIHGTCPDGCPLDRKDGVCMNRKDTFCAPDCASGVPLLFAGIGIVTIAGIAGGWSILKRKT